MAEHHSDALILFGATGDLAYKQIFPALHAMTRRGHLNIPVIGVARGNWTVEQLRARARDSIAAHGDPDPETFSRFAERLHYVAGDYQDAATYDALRRTLGSVERPLFYLAIPPGLFGTVVSELARSGCATQARVIVEKPFGRALASAQALTRPFTDPFQNPPSIASITSSAKKRCRISSISGSPTRFLSRFGAATTSTAFKSPCRKRSTCGAGAASTRKSAPFVTSSRIISCRFSRCSPWTRHRHCLVRPPW